MCRPEGLNKWSRVIGIIPTFSEKWNRSVGEILNCSGRGRCAQSLCRLAFNHNQRNVDVVQNGEEVNNCLCHRTLQHTFIACSHKFSLVLTSQQRFHPIWRPIARFYIWKRAFFGKWNRKGWFVSNLMPRSCWPDTGCGPLWTVDKRVAFTAHFRIAKMGLEIKCATSDLVRIAVWVPGEHLSVRGFVLKFPVNHTKYAFAVMRRPRGVLPRASVIFCSHWKTEETKVQSISGLKRATLVGIDAGRFWAADIIPCDWSDNGNSRHAVERQLAVTPNSHRVRWRIRTTLHTLCT